ncbi:MAG: hypothetical protein RLZZ262_79 [Bacteroidota bacterium]|jgi:hypothetical protein
MTEESRYQVAHYGDYASSKNVVLVQDANDVMIWRSSYRIKFIIALIWVILLFVVLSIGSGWMVFRRGDGTAYHAAYQYSIMGLFAVFLYFTSKSLFRNEKIILDKKLGVIYFNSGSKIRERLEDIPYPIHLKNITKLQVIPFDTDGMGKGYQLNILLDSNEVVNLFCHGDKHAMLADADKIARFIDVKLESYV